MFDRPIVDLTADCRKNLVTPVNEPRTPPESALISLGAVNLNLLVPLVALLEERSVTAAADRVGLSQPAMSHALRKIRQLLGDELLVRQGSGFELTPRAVELLGPLKEVLHQTASLVGSTPFEAATDGRTVTIAMTTSTALVLGPRLMAILNEQAPGMTLKIKTGNMTAPTVFTDDGVDAVLITETLSAPHPRERLFDDRWIVITSPDIDPQPNVRTLIETEPHLVFEDPLRKLGAYVVLDDLGIDYRVSLRVTDYLLIPYLVARSHGIALHRWQATEEFSGMLDLKRYEFPFPIQTIGVDLVWNPWLADVEFKAWLKAALFEAARPLQERYSLHA